MPISVRIRIRAGIPCNELIGQPVGLVGLRITDYLPAQSTKPESLATESPAKPAWGGTETILLVESEPLLRALAQSILEPYGYRIFAVGSGSEALAVWEKDATQINLWLTNLALPDGPSGHELGVRFRAQKAELKVLYASGYSLNLAQSNDRLRLGLNFLPKPYSATALAQAVRRCLDNDGLDPENPR